MWAGKINMILLSGFIFQFIFTVNGFGQREVILKRKIKITSPLPEYIHKGCDYELLLPANRLGRQEVIEYKYNITPKYLIKAPDDELLAKWEQLSFSEAVEMGIEAETRLKINIYDLKTAKSNPVIDKDDIDTLKYLKSEENFQVDSKQIKEAAASILGTTREEIVQDIFDFVTFRLDYKIFLEQDRGAKKALGQGEGDCTEYSELMVTLCRVRNIPARIQMGIVLKSSGDVGYHNWVEVFFEQYGWVSFDPTAADAPNAVTTFDSMKNGYIHLSNRRYIKNVTSTCSAREYSYSWKIDDRYELILKAAFSPIPNDQKELFQKMWALYNANEFEKTLALLDTLIKQKPHFSYYSYKGVVYARTGEFDKGLECLQNGLRMAKSDIEKNSVLYSFANYFALKEDKEFAVSYLKKAIELGFKQYEHLENDTDFVKIKDYQPFIDLKNELKIKTVKN